MRTTGAARTVAESVLTDIRTVHGQTTLHYEHSVAWCTLAYCLVRALIHA
jgi:hypothetical protein